jgi:tRNA-specific 2-thiouridylase
MGNEKKKVAVGLSGGVDSSVAAALLQKEHYDVMGITMAIFYDSFEIDELAKHACYGPGEEGDIQAASSICEELDIPFHVIDLKKEYRKCVLDYFRSEYLKGRTPNPCIVCNRELKFGFLLSKARQLGVHFDFFATGHYVRKEVQNDRFLLKKAKDPSKDQSYFLYGLTQEQLSQTIFPLGNYTKLQVRKIAQELKLESGDRPESQDFIAGGDYSLLFDRDELKKGEIVDEEGNVLGNHRGVIYYTLGQRRGLGIASAHPLYVKAIDAAENRIVVGKKDDLYAKGLIARKLNLIAKDKLDQIYKIKTKIRIQHCEVDSTIVPYGQDAVKVLFDTPQMSVTPGQSAVFYEGDIVLGGGVIEEPL